MSSRLLGWIKTHPDTKVALSQQIGLADPDIFRVDLTVDRGAVEEHRLITTFFYATASDIVSGTVVDELDRRRLALKGAAR